MNVQYQQTGNQIHLPIDEMISHVRKKLEEYDELETATGSKPDFSPYGDPIIYITVEGKTVEIPKYIQEKAINMHKTSRDNVGSSGSENNDQNDGGYMPSFETDLDCFLLKNRGLGYINDGYRHIGLNQLGSPLVDENIVESDDLGRINMQTNNNVGRIGRNYDGQVGRINPHFFDRRFDSRFDPRLNMDRKIFDVSGGNSYHTMFYVVIAIIILMFGFYLYKDSKK